jgi:cytochrome c
MKTRILNRQIECVALCLALLGIPAVSNAVDVDAAKVTARQNNCFRCHSIEKDKDGPAWSKVASKYKGNANAQAKLYSHLTTGEKAKFPDGHEEDHTIVKTDNAAEINNLVDWILSL